MLGSCLNLTYEDCRVRKSIGHHLYWPKNNYSTELERNFRNLPQNILQICACAEREIHLGPAPKKPSVQEMVVALTVSLEPEVLVA